MDELSLDSYLFHRDLRAGFDAPIVADETFVEALDGARLAASVWRARTHDAGANAPVIVAPATGVKRSYYAPFARYLARRGFDVVTFDYRGIGGSRRAAESPTMLEWGELDLAGVVRWARGTLDSRRSSEGGHVSIVGHSVGGQLVGFLPDVDRIDAFVSVGAQFGDYRLWPMPSRLAMALVWHALVPAVTRTVGYLPGAIGIGENLPKGVALEWARWCRTPGYFSTDLGPSRLEMFARLRAPILAFGFDDDVYAPAAAIDALHALYSNAPIERRQINRVPGAGAGRIGHFGFFRRRFEGSLWAEVASFLERPNLS